jgi:hypothetical protein
METLAFSPTATGRQLPYMSQGFQGIGSQISHNYINSLGILNAEAFDDGTGVLRAREASEMRLKHSEPTMPFGITSGPKITLDPELRTDTEEPDAGSRRRKKPRIETQSGDDEEDARKKARGRPRVDTKDETAADVSPIWLYDLSQLDAWIYWEMKISISSNCCISFSLLLHLIITFSHIS